MNPMSLYLILALSRTLLKDRHGPVNPQVNGRNSLSINLEAKKDGSFKPQETVIRVAELCREVHTDHPRTVCTVDSSTITPNKMKR